MSAQAEPGAHAVGEALLGAQPLHQPGREASAPQHDVHQARPDAVFVRTRDALVCDGDARLRQVRAIHHHDAALLRHAGRRRRARLGLLARLPAAEGLAHPLQQALHLDVPGREEDRDVGHEDASVEGPRRGGVEAHDRFPHAVLGAAVAVPVVEQLREMPARQRGRVVLGSLERGQDLVPRLARLAGREARPEHHVRQDLEQRAQVFGEPGHPHGGGIPAARDRERRAQLVHGPGQRERVAVAGPATHQLRGEGGQARPVPGQHGLAAAQRHPQAHPRQAVVFEHQHVEPVVQLRAMQRPGLHHRCIDGGRGRELPGGPAPQRAAGSQACQRQQRCESRLPHRDGSGAAASPSGSATTRTTLRRSSRR
jgi:hypothetical protein